MSADFLDCGKFKIFKIQPVTHIYTKGKQGNGNLGDNPSLVVADIGIITANISNSAEHRISL